MKRLIGLFLVSGSIILAQSITVTASRTIYTQPDQVLFEVDVNSGLDASLDAVVAALAGSGITSANLSSVGGSGFSLKSGVPTLQWTFRSSAPLSKLNDMIASFTTLQQNIAKKNAGLSMAFSVQGTQTSPQQCSTPDLISDARAQAQKLANAAGVSVGPILAVSESGSAGIPAFDLIGDFSATAAFFVGIPTFFAPTPPSNCSLTVKFAMVR